MKYYIYVNGDKVCSVSGTEAAYEAWRRAVSFAHYIGAIADLVDGETGEVVESNDEDR